MQRELQAFQNIESRITFTNPQDMWALTGEPCTKWLSDGTCDETLGSNGKPLYYQDIYWTNGHWDAPKADSRILEALIYLVTPADQGGAGHEHITVGKIIQNTQKDTEFTDANSTSTSTDTDDDGQVSSHYYDQTNPEHPTQLAEAVDITQIDNIRVTTRITQEHRLGGNSTSYQYKSFPINVAWQSDQGLAQSPPPNPDSFYTGSLQSVTGAFGQLLSNLGLSTDVDPTKTSITNLSQLAQYVGGQSLSTLFGGGSLEGSNLTTTLDNFGRSYLESQLKLPTGALSHGTTTQQVIQNVGETVAETNLGLPAGSLAGSTSNQIYQNIGARYFESQVFNVSQGTLTSGGINNQDQLLEALGRGKIEEQYGLDPGSLSGLSTASQLINLNYKTQNTFTAQNANLVDDDLALTYASGPMADSHNETASSYDNATSRLVSGQLGLPAYELLVGIRDWDSTIGQFNSTTPSDTFQKPATVQACDSDSGSSSTNGKPDVGTCISNATSSSFAPYLLQNLGVNLSSLASASSGSSQSIVNTALASTLGQQLVSSKAFSQTQLTSLVTDAAAIVLPAVFGNYTVTSIKQAPSELQLDNSLKDMVTAGLDPVSNAIADQTTQTDSELPATDAQAADTFLTAANSMLDSDMNNWTELLTEQDQSGGSAGLDLPGVLPEFNLNATQSNATPVSSTMLLSADPVTELSQGNLSELPTVGKLELAKSLTTSKIDQYQIASELGTDTSAAITDLNPTAIPIADTSKLVGNGLTADDFAKIFQENLAPDVFSRVGESELLSTVWNEGSSTDQSAVQEASTVSPEAEAAASTLGTSSGNLSFYTGQWSDLQSIADKLVSQSEGTNASLTSQISQYADRDLGSSSDVTASANVLQTLINQLSSNAENINSLKSQAEQAINNIDAGQNLSLYQTPGIAPTGQSAAGCWSQSSLQSSLQNLNSVFSNVTTGIAACQLDTSLNLPANSIEGYLQRVQASSSNSTIQQFEAAIGSAQAGTTSFPTYTQEVSSGLNILEQQAVSTLANQIPGLSSLTNAVGLTPQSIFGLIQGVSEPVKITLGGYTLDTQLQLPAGTMANVVDPTCDLGACTSEQAQDSRLNSLAVAGMKELGYNLDMPASLDITGQGDFATNYGISYLSQELGLATNTFSGSFSQLVSNNAPSTVLNDFGLGDTPYDTNLQSIASALDPATLLGGSSSGTAFSMDSDIISELNSQVSTDQNQLIGSMENTNSILYTGGTPTPQAVTGFAQPMVSNYTSILQKISSQASGIPQLESVIQPYLTQATTPQATPGASDSGDDSSMDEYGIPEINSMISNYQSKISSLDSSFKLPGGTFAQYVQGKVGSGDITDTVGTQQAKATLGDQAINQFLASTNNTTLKDLISGLKTATVTPSCPSGATISDLFLGSSSKASAGCSISGVNLNQIFTGTSASDKSDRLLLYNDFLAPMFGTSLEKEMDIPEGTIRSMALNPQQAPEIALGAGLNMVANQLFQFSSKDSGFEKQAMQSLETALVHSIYNPAAACTSTSTTALNPCASQYTQVTPSGSSGTSGAAGSFQRSLSSLTSTVQSTLQKELNTYSKQYLGTTVQLSDITSIASGDTNGLIYMGLQRFAFSTNQALLQQSGNDPRAAAFELNYANIRDSLDIGNPTDADYTAAFDDGVASQMRSWVTDDQIDCTDSTNKAICSAVNASNFNPSDPTSNQELATLATSTPFIVTGVPDDSSDSLGDGTAFGEFDSIPSTLDTTAAPASSTSDDLFLNDSTGLGIQNATDATTSAVESAGAAGIQSYAANRKKIGQQNLQYQMYDIAAFELDKNIPVGFSKAMLDGNQATRSDMLGQFAFNALNFKDSSLGAFLTPQAFGGLTEFVASDFKDTTNLDQGAVTGLANWATSQFKAFGLDLPAGTMLGVLGWASTGFASNQLASSKITTGPLACNAGTACKFSSIVPIGTVLENWGEQQIFGWADKELGFNAGSTYQIYQAAVNIYKVTKIAETAATTADEANAFANAAEQSGDASLAEEADQAADSADTQAATAAANQAEAIGQEVGIVINAVFSKQIGQAETQLGLVPGTGSIAVTMLATLLVESIMGTALAVNPLTLALFIGMNLFGVYKVQIDESATADGYYPYVGKYGATGLADPTNPNTLQVPSPDYQLGEFDPRSSKAYDKGLEAAAQAKVQSVLADMLLFPTQWGAAQGIDPAKLRVSQAFTLRSEDLDDLDYLISQPSPTDTPSGYGYGPLSERCDTSSITQDSSSKQYTCTPNGNRFGFFASSLFWNQIYFRW